jgi:hypothetical protein
MTPQSDSEVESAGENKESEQSDESDIDLDNDECGSSDDDMESGSFFR